MEQYVKNNLQNGEMILWSGTPSNVKLLEAPYTLGIILRWILAAVLAAFAIWYQFYSTTVGISSRQALLFGAAMLICAAYLALDPIRVCSRLKKKTLYCITNQRVIACYRARSMRLKFRTLDELDETSMELLSTGCGTLYFGAVSKRAPKLARVQYSMNQQLERDEQMPLVFYSVKDPEIAYSTVPVKRGDIA